MPKTTGAALLKAKSNQQDDAQPPLGAGSYLTDSADIWAFSGNSQIRNEILMFYPQDVATPPTGGTSGSGLVPQENGSGSTTAAQGGTGDARIDGILSGVKWAGSITYSDTDSSADYGGGWFYDGDGDGVSAHNESFSQFTAAQTLAFHTALNDSYYTQPVAATALSVEAFTGLSITYNGAGSATATIRGANSSDPGTAYAFYPDNSVYGGDTFFSYYSSNQTPTAGNYGWHTMFHELGHSLGLKHGQSTGGPSNVALPTAWDSIEFSVMTYRSYVGAPLSGYSYEQWGAPQTYMMLDILALQTMYGADYSVNSGDTVYTWSPTSGETYIDGSVAIDPGGNRIFATIWDGGGVDTYDLSNYGTDLTLNLNPGSHSVFSQAQLAYLGYNGSNVYARGNIFNALQFGASTASLIENATGGSGNDTITGNVLNNVLLGNNGIDTLIGGDGNDTLDGGSGDDIIYGGNGSDIIYGGWNNDTLYGEAGNDVFIIRQSFDTDFGDAVNGGADIDLLDLSQILTSFGSIVNLSTGVWQYVPIYGGTFTITGVENVYGTQLADTITGDASDNVLAGFDGDDVIDGGTGDDTLYGGNGNDVLDGSYGQDVIYGGAGDDIIYGGFVGDIVYGEGGNDVFIMRQSGAGTEYGDDTYGGSGTDRLDLSQITATYGSTVNLLTGTWQYNPLYGGPWTILDVENVDGTQLADTITGDALVNILNGNGGNDIIDGGDGADVINGGAGNDTIYGGSGDNLLIGGDGNDVITGGSGNEQLRGGAGNDIFDGSSGQDLFYGEEGNDTLRILNGWNGGYGEVFIGGAGIDTFDFTGTSGLNANVNLTDGEFEDAVFPGYGISLASVERVLAGAGNDNITGSGEANTLAGNAGNDSLYGLAADDTLLGGDGNDILDGGEGTDTMNGGLGDDIFYVDRSDDVVIESANAGTDIVYATVTYSLIGSNVENATLTGALSSSLTGNGLDNILEGNSGANKLVGNNGNDILRGFDGDDILEGGVGDDVMNGGLGIDTADYRNATAGVTVNLSVGAAQNTVGAGTDTLGNIENIYGSAYADTLTGNSIANDFIGGVGNDILNGAAGDDTLNGGGNNDTLNGGTGLDTLTGGVGNDIFAFLTTFAASNVDTVTDYVVANDTINLASAAVGGMAVGTLAAGAFRIGAAAADASDRIIYNSATGALLFDADGNGAGAAVQFASLSTGLAMTNAEFVIV